MRVFELSEQTKVNLRFSYGQQMVDFLEKIEIEAIYSAIQISDALVGRENWKKIPKKSGNYTEKNLASFVKEEKLRFMRESEKKELLDFLNSSQLETSIRQNVDLQYGNCMVLDCPIQAKENAYDSHSVSTATLGKGAYGKVSIGVILPLQRPASPQLLLEELDIIATKQAESIFNLESDKFYAQEQRSLLFEAKKINAFRPDSYSVSFKSTPGIPLNKFVRQYDINFSQLLRINFSFFEEIIRLKENGLIHEDLKPNNLLVDAQGNIRAIDLNSSIKYESNNLETQFYFTNMDALARNLSANIPQSNEISENIPAIGVEIKKDIDFLLKQLMERILLNGSQNPFFEELEYFKNLCTPQNKKFSRFLALVEPLDKILEDLKKKDLVNSQEYPFRAEVAQYLFAHYVQKKYPSAYQAYCNKFNNPIEQQESKIFKKSAGLNI